MLDLTVAASGTNPDQNAEQLCGPAEASWSGSTGQRRYSFTEPGIYQLGTCGAEVQVVP